MKPIIDFNILPNADPRYLLVADSSIWEHAESKASIIEITLPGTSKKITHYFSKSQINQYNSVNLYISCTDDCAGCENYEYLPDGVYTIKVIASPDTFYNEKFHLQTAQLRLSLDKKYIETNVLADRVVESVRKYFEEVEFLIRVAEANTHLGNIEKAYNLYVKAKEMTENCPC